MNIYSNNNHLIDKKIPEDNKDLVFKPTINSKSKALDVSYSKELRKNKF